MVPLTRIFSTCSGFFIKYFTQLEAHYNLPRGADVYCTACFSFLKDDLVFDRAGVYTEHAHSAACFFNNRMLYTKVHLCNGILDPYPSLCDPSNMYF